MKKLYWMVIPTLMLLVGCNIISSIKNNDYQIRISTEVKDNCVYTYYHTIDVKTNDTIDYWSAVYCK